ncbi:hypothetical protein CR513_06097, partial [Mucuna pruriens]
MKKCYGALWKQNEEIQAIMSATLSSNAHNPTKSQITYMSPVNTNLMTWQPWHNPRIVALANPKIVT